MAEPLTPLDATFLELEQLDEGATMHIGGVLVFDPLPQGGAPPLADVQATLGARLSLLPRYSQRLSQERTGGLVWPRWEDDPLFDIRTHVRAAALPAPGGERELCEWAADFFSHRLDRTRPLWEMALVQGLSGGRWALATKTHHCLVDGVGSIGVAQVLLDAEPAPPGRPAAPARASSQPASASHAPHLWALDTAAALAELGVRAAGAGARAVLHPRRALARSSALAKLIVRDELIAAPRTSINVPIGATRRYEVVHTSLGELKALGRQLGGSVNDLLLAACTTALRRLLLSRGEAPPAAGMRAMVPMNVRDGAEALDLGNRVNSLFVQLPVAEEDPRERLHAIVAHTRALKSSDAALGTDTMLELAGLAPPLLHAAIARALYATRLFNVTITNVPGPNMPLYGFGGRLREVHPIVPLAAEHAVGIAIVSYDGRLTLGLSADCDTTPDLHVLAEGVREGLAELRALAPGGGPAGAHPTPAARRPRAGGRAAAKSRAPAAGDAKN